METRILQIAAILAAVALVGGGALAVVAADGDTGEQSGGFLRHLHKLGEHLHGGGGHHDQMAQLIDQLELTPDQLQRFEKIHEVMENSGGGGNRAMLDLHDSLVTQFERGHVGSAEIRQAIDGHLEELRVMAYAVTDELVALINELDETQRAVVLKHLEGNKSSDHGHGH